MSKQQPGEHSIRTNHFYYPEKPGTTLVEGAMIRTICSLNIPYAPPKGVKGGVEAETCAFCKNMVKRMHHTHAKTLVLIGPAPALARVYSSSVSNRLARAAELREHADAVA